MNTVPSFIEHINEAKGNTNNVLASVIAALPELENAIKNSGGLKVKLKANMNGGNIHIYSDQNFAKKDLGKMGSMIFDEFEISWWGGSINESNTEVWFNPKVSWSLKSGGTNGADFVWSSVWFNYETNEWKFAN